MQEKTGWINSREKIKVSIIISAYNEEKNIKRVVKTVLESKLFAEIICVNDGSTDKTLKILEGFGNKIKIVSFKKNRGKSYVMVAGVKSAKGDIVLFCDADLTKIKKSHFLGMILPLKLGVADQVLAIRENDLEPFKKLTGERAYFRKDLLQHLKRFEKTKFGAETYLNNAFKNKRTYWYFEEGLVQAGKGGETFISKVLCADKYLKEGYEIFSEIIRQKKPSQVKEVEKIIIRINKTYECYFSLLKKLLTEKDIKQIWEKDIKKHKNIKKRIKND